MQSEVGRGKDVQIEDGMWNVPPKYRLWQLFSAHRDYFWRLGLCIPGGDPHDWDREYPQLGIGRDEVSTDES